MALTRPQEEAYRADASPLGQSRSVSLRSGKRPQRQATQHSVTDRSEENARSPVDLALVVTGWPGPQCRSEVAVLSLLPSHFAFGVAWFKMRAAPAEGDSSLIRPRACLDSSRGGWGSWQQFSASSHWMASASIALFGSSLPMLCSVKVAPRRLIAAAACAASWIPPAMSWQVTCARTVGPGAFVCCCQGGDAAGHDLTAGAEDGREGSGSEAVRWRLDVPSGQQVRDDRVDGAACPAQPAGGDGAGGRCPRRPGW
jgi:hypothetical protein